jgi:hypothetical protein
MHPTLRQKLGGGLKGCLWLGNLTNRRFKTFPKRKDPALFFRAEGLFILFFDHPLTLLLIGGRRLFKYKLCLLILI